MAGYDAAFLDELADLLEEEGVCVVWVETVEGAVQALEDGHRPDAVVIDGTFKEALALLRELRRHRHASQVPLLAAAPLRPEIMDAGALVQRRNVDDVIATLDLLCGSRDAV